MGLYWHHDHDALASWCQSYEARVQHIRARKPQEEHELRLRLFQPVREPPAQLVWICQLYDQVSQLVDELDRTTREVAREGLSVPLYVLDDLGSVREAALQTYMQVAAARNLDLWEWVKSDQAQALHQLECPECPWNGYSIFPDRAYW